MRPTSLLPLLLALTACSNTVSGTVDGEKPGAVKSAIFDELAIDIPFVDDATVVLVIVTDIPHACETMQDLVDAADDGSCAEQCVDLGAVADEQLGRDDYYSLSITLNADSEVARAYDFDEGLSLDSFTAAYDAWDVHTLYDPAACEDECDDGADPIVQRNDEAGGGSLEITDYTSMQRLEGSYAIDFGGDDALEGRFDAERCDMSDWIWWL